MKQFVMRKPNFEANNPFGTLGVITQVCSGDGRGNLNVMDIRDRIGILDTVEAATGETVEMDDKQHKKLCELIEAFPFAVAHRGLLTIIDDVLNATDVKGH